jgi:hypothetical protein
LAKRRAACNDHPRWFAGGVRIDDVDAIGHPRVIVYNMQARLGLSWPIRIHSM